MRQALTRRYEKVGRRGRAAGPHPHRRRQGQMGVAREVLAELGLDITMFGVAKGEEPQAGPRRAGLPRWSRGRCICAPTRRPCT